MDPCCLPRKEPETPRNLERNSGTMVKPWWNLGGTFCGTFWQPKTDVPHLVEPWRNLAKPGARPFGSRRRICPREPGRVRKQFCPETFTMAEDPKAYSCWGKNLFLQLNTAWQTQKGIRISNRNNTNHAQWIFLHPSCAHRDDRGSQDSIISKILPVAASLHYVFFASLPIELRALSVREALVILKDNVCK